MSELSRIRFWFRKILSQGWTDALRSLYPEEAVYTFWDYFRNSFARNAGIRIDHFLLNAPAAPMLASAGVDREVRGWEKTRDHAPVWITCNPRANAARRRNRSSRGA